jgi:NADPH2:quinone reductase
MKAAVIHQPGGPEVLTYDNVPDPVPGDGEVLIDVAAVSIEGGDLGIRRAAPGDMLPLVPGFSAAGTVVAVGGDVTGVREGDRVATFNYTGSHAAQRVVPAHYVYPVPEAVSLEQASTLPVAFGTADEALFTAGLLEPGATVLVRGATGGVGVAAVELAHRAGATVIATASGAEAAGKLLDLGADQVVRYREEDLVARVREFTAGEGVDLLLELVGGPEFPGVLDTLAPGGRVVGVGAASGTPAQLSLQDLGARQVTATGVFFGGVMHLPRVHDMIARRFGEMASGEITMPVAREFALSEVVAAHRYAEAGHPFGRVLLVP